MRDGGHVFSQVPRADIPRSSFNRSHGHKTTLDAGLLVPVFVDEVLPGDTFNLKASIFARLATPIVPVMDNMYMDMFFFFVPNRLLWDQWQRFCGEQDNPGDSIDFLVPYVDHVSAAPVSLGMADYFGIPLRRCAPCAFPFRAYNLIFNEWFRDENLVNRAWFSHGDGPDLPEYFPLQRRGKRHDYFTSCLPWPQKGPGVEIPIASSAPVVATSLTIGPTFNTYPGVGVGDQLDVTSSNFTVTHPTPGVGVNQLRWENPGLTADLTNATAATINTLRQAFQIQKLLERDARGGTRYIELLRSHFGVVSPDARLQRPEFLGGGSIPIHVNPVAQTSGSPPIAGGYTPTPQGNLAAFGVAAAGGIGFSKSFVEHGVILGLVSVRADMSYQQGLHKMWSRRSRYDFYWPAFAHLGEQSVLQREIFLEHEDAAGNTNDDVFGYQERWAEYRYFPSKITGQFRSDSALPLDVWHLAQKFDVPPKLDKTFIEENPPIDRVIAVPSEPHFLFDSHFTMKCTRPMPVYSVPGMIDHF
ncbi:MAG: major capsid protein [Microvirus sp.]|nr:MAG: major capsid protein [Microvirus sp.]